MFKESSFKNVKFSNDIILAGLEKLKSFLDEKQKNESFSYLRVRFENETWRHDSNSEFFADYSQDSKSACFTKEFGHFKLEIDFSGKNTDVRVTAPARSQIEDVQQIFFNNAEKCTLPTQQDEDIIIPTIFIGHGRNIQWRELKDHLQDKHEYEVEAYEVGARAGHTIRDILDEMLRRSSFALLVMTGEDRDEDGNMHARENVIHEIGLFQGKLGFSRAIVLLEEGTTEFSNMQGIHQIRFAKNNIKETFGDVLATLRREFGN